jgi:hypothetical protein
LRLRVKIPKIGNAILGALNPEQWSRYLKRVRTNLRNSGFGNVGNIDYLIG